MTGPLSRLRIALIAVCVACVGLGAPATGALATSKHHSKHHAKKHHKSHSCIKQGGGDNDVDNHGGPSDGDGCQ